MQVLKDKWQTIPQISIVKFIISYLLVTVGAILLASLLNKIDITHFVSLSSKGSIAFLKETLIGTVIISVAIFFFTRLFTVKLISVAWLNAIPCYFVILSLPREVSTVFVLLLCALLTYILYCALERFDFLSYQDCDNETI